MHAKKRNDFIQAFKQKYPNYEIISFEHISKPIIFKDPEGFIHKKNKAFRVISNNVRLDSIIDKKGYIQYKLDMLGTGLTLIEFNGMKKKAIVKDVNGFTYSPTVYDLLKGHKVTIESCNEKEDLFIYKSSIKHNNKYKYGSFVYTNGKQKVPIICPIHGEFMMCIESHLFGCGCRYCKRDSASFSRSIWIEKFKHKLCTFYVLEFYNEKESFIKSGITSLSIKKRYRGCSKFKYNVIVDIKGDSEYISNLEKSFINKFKKFKYTPFSGFNDGQTECFLLDIKNTIYEQFKF
jgi:hypothetical protein